VHCKILWIVSGVRPQRCEELVQWVADHGSTVWHLRSASQLPLQVALEAPDKVGIDRLLNAVAANRRRRPQAAAILVDAGSAVTVDYVDAAGVFRGGAIFPGLRLMAQALHDHTALLPVVPIDTVLDPPGTSTIDAIRTGVYYGVLGGIERLIAEYQRHSATPIDIFLTGGDAKLLASKILSPVQVWPEMTLEGIMHSQAKLESTLQGPGQ
jgi:type III pantothenate kinase